jgi:hypothetical protein
MQEKTMNAISAERARLRLETINILKQCFEKLESNQKNMMIERLEGREKIVAEEIERAEDKERPYVFRV